MIHSFKMLKKCEDESMNELTQEMSYFERWQKVIGKNGQKALIKMLYYNFVVINK